MKTCSNLLIQLFKDIGFLTYHFDNTDSFIDIKTWRLNYPFWATLLILSIWFSTEWPGYLPCFADCTKSFEKGLSSGENFNTVVRNVPKRQRNNCKMSTGCAKNNSISLQETVKMFSNKNVYIRNTHTKMKLFTTSDSSSECLWCK